MADPETPLVEEAGEAHPSEGSPQSSDQDGTEDAGRRMKGLFDDPVKDKGLGVYGCDHYRRRCRILAPCCGEEFGCRHCHNQHQEEKVNSDHHEVPRHDVKQVVCLLCGTDQEVHQFCSKCGVCMGQYFCQHCKFYDDDVSKQQFHCEQCGICRVGGREKFFHCSLCDCCYSVSLRNNHRCVEKAMNHNCPVCFEYLFDSLQPTAVLERCGHTLHSSCLSKLVRHGQTFSSCPVCSKSIGDNTDIWTYIDQKIEEEPMPADVERREVPIICNDCEKSSTARFHYYGMKCEHCGSYNTRQ